MRFLRLPAMALLLALVSAAAIAAGLAAVSINTALLKSLEHWTTDWRTALLADRATTQHPKVAVVLIDDDSVFGLPYRSPIDRGLLARLVEALDKAGARAIGLDFLFDQPTEPDKDQQLIGAIRKAGEKVVLGVVDTRVPLRAERRDFMARFIAEAGAATGYLNLRYEIDNVIRGEADRGPPPHASTTPADSFAAAVAQKGGATTAAPVSRIAWLGPPADGSDTFQILPAAQLVAPANDMERKLAQMMLAQLRDRVVLIGGDLSDHTDRHPTPMSKLNGEPMPGVVVHAHAVAQALDGRRLGQLGWAWESALVFLLSAFGFLLGWRFRANGWVTSTIPMVILAVLDAIFFAGLRIIVPFAAPAIGWLAGVFAGRGTKWLLRSLVT